ncbi:MAG: single-stranded DNA-binding protein [Oscillospiraceae bacterium]
MSLNHIVIMGRLTRDPELRYTQSQTPVASFRLAVDRDFQPKDGGEKQTDFIDVVAWRQTGEFVSKYFTKGSMAVVSGRLQMREWTDKENNKRISAEIVANNIYFGESKRGDSAASGGARPATAPVDVTGPSFAELDDGDGELPF